MHPTGLECIQTKLPLGRNLEQPEYYDPAISRRSPSLARGAEGIDASKFEGQDLWNCWEVSWFDLQGKPVTRIGQLVVPANSPNLCESKSLKYQQLQRKLKTRRRNRSG